MTIYVFKHHIPHIHLPVFTAISTRIIVNFRKRYDPCRGFHPGISFMKFPVTAGDVAGIIIA